MWCVWCVRVVCLVYVCGVCVCVCGVCVCLKFIQCLKSFPIYVAQALSLACISGAAECSTNRLSVEAGRLIYPCSQKCCFISEARGRRSVHLTRVSTQFKQPNFRLCCKEHQTIFPVYKFVSKFPHPYCKATTATPAYFCSQKDERAKYRNYCNVLLFPVDPPPHPPI